MKTEALAASPGRVFVSGGTVVVVTLNMMYIFSLSKVKPLQDQSSPKMYYLILETESLNSTSVFQGDAVAVKLTVEGNEVRVNLSVVNPSTTSTTRQVRKLKIRVQWLIFGRNNGQLTP